MRLLVTGGAGFIGANFVHECVREHPEDSVTVLDALTYAGSRESLAPVESDIRLLQGDITDGGLVDKLVGEADAVVHFAAAELLENGWLHQEFNRQMPLKSFLQDRAAGLYQEIIVHGSKKHVHFTQFGIRSGSKGYGRIIERNFLIRIHLK